MPSKCCTRCNIVKELKQFRKNKERHDGLSSICRECFRKLDKEQRSRPQVIELRKKYKGKYKCDSDEQKLKQKQWREARPDLRRAATTLDNEIRRDRMPRASTLKCVHCGKQAHDYHHHNGYAFEHRLDVIPLCSSCHMKEHGRLRRMQKAEKRTTSTI